MSNLSKTKIGISSAAGILVIVSLLWFSTTGPDPNAEHTLAGYPVSRSVRYGFAVKNTTGKAMKQAELWVFAPVKRTSTQRLVKLVVSHPYEIIEDDLGNQLLHFVFKTLPPYGTTIVRIRADLAIADQPRPLDVGMPDLFLAQEPLVESTAPEISAQAVKLRGKNPMETARKISAWVADNIKYTGYAGGEKGALFALKQKQGDCTEFADLFVALMRADNLPARRLGGYIMPTGGLLEAATYHNWAEFYEDGTWLLADPQNKVFGKKQSEYVAMRILKESEQNIMGVHGRFRVKGEGVQVKMTL